MLVNQRARDIAIAHMMHWPVSYELEVAEEECAPLAAMWVYGQVDQQYLARHVVDMRKEEESE